MPSARRVGSWRLPPAGARSTEELVEAGRYGYAHSCMTSEVFPVRPSVASAAREVVLVEFDVALGAADALAAATALGLERPVYEDALVFGASYPDVQRAAPIVFLHEPWLGYFGRLDVLCLWENAGRREIGLEGFESLWRPGYRFAFTRGGSRPGPDSGS